MAASDIGGSKRAGGDTVRDAHLQVPGDSCGAKKRRVQTTAFKPFVWEPGFDFTQPELKKAWEQDGYVIVKGLLQSDELKRVEESLIADPSIETHSYGLDDGMGRKSRIALWRHPNGDVTGMVPRTPKVAGLMGELLGGEVYHYHTKLMKNAKTGGAHLWHQDFGYWNQNGNVFPDMGTAFITLDKMDGENGGLQVIRGSHKLGLLQHHKKGYQAEADAVKIDWAIKAGLEPVQLELDPGDAVFFSCLTLHRSAQNNSDRRRWCFLIAFNRADNDPMIRHHFPNFTPLELTDDDAIRNPSTPLVDSVGKDFFDLRENESFKKLKNNGFH